MDIQKRMKKKARIELQFAVYGNEQISLHLYVMNGPTERS